LLDGEGIRLAGRIGGLIHEPVADGWEAGGIWIPEIGDLNGREALGEMVSCKLRLNDPRAALSYAQMMMAIPAPDEYVWNRRGKFYGYLAVQLLKVQESGSTSLPEALLKILK
jgi:hypothetical protein